MRSATRTARRWFRARPEPPGAQQISPGRDGAGIDRRPAENASQRATSADYHVLALAVAGFAEALAERGNTAWIIATSICISAYLRSARFTCPTAPACDDLVTRKRPSAAVK
jgi:hypothetical protein